MRNVPQTRDAGKRSAPARRCVGQVELASPYYDAYKAVDMFRTDPVRLVRLAADYQTPARLAAAQEVKNTGDLYWLLREQDWQLGSDTPLELCDRQLFRAWGRWHRFTLVTAEEAHPPERNP